MFFVRFAVAALSLGSVAKVLAAPVGVPPGVPSFAGASVAFPGGLERRLDLSLQSVVATATSELGAVRDEVGDLLKDPVSTVKAELSSVVAKVAPVLKTVSDTLKAANVDPASLLTDATGNKLTADVMGANISTLLNSVNDMLASLKVAGALGNLQAPITDIKRVNQLSGLDSALDILPEVKAVVAPLLATLLGLLGSILGNILGDLTGSLGLLAGIPPLV